MTSIATRFPGPFPNDSLTHTTVIPTDPDTRDAQDLTLPYRQDQQPHQSDSHLCIDELTAEDWSLDSIMTTREVKEEGSGTYCLDADILICQYSVNGCGMKRITLERAQVCNYLGELLFGLTTMMKVGELSRYENSKEGVLEVKIIDAFHKEVVYNDNDSFVEVYLTQKSRESRYRPERFSRVSLHFEIKEYLTDDVSGESNHAVFISNEENEFSFDVGTGDVPIALELGIMRFTLGQSGFIRASPDLFLGPNENNSNKLSAFCDMQCGGSVYGPSRSNIFDNPNEVDNDSSRNVIQLASIDRRGDLCLDESADDSKDINPRFLLKPASTNLMERLGTSLFNKKVVIDKIQIRRLARIWDCTKISNEEGDLRVHLEHWKGCGNRMYNIKDWNRAASCYSEVLSRIDRLAPAAKYELAILRQICLRNLAMSLIQMNEFKKAAVKLREAVKINPDDDKALYWLGRVCFIEGSYVEAVEFLRRAGLSDPSNKMISTAKAEAELQACKYSLKCINTGFLSGSVVSHNLYPDETELQQVQTNIEINSNDGVDRRIDLEGELDMDFLNRFGIKLI